MVVLTAVEIVTTHLPYIFFAQLRHDSFYKYSRLDWGEPRTALFLLAKIGYDVERRSSVKIQTRAPALHMHRTSKLSCECSIVMEEKSDVLCVRYFDVKSYKKVTS